MKNRNEGAEVGTRDSLDDQFAILVPFTTKDRAEVHVAVGFCMREELADALRMADGGEHGMVRLFEMTALECDFHFKPLMPRHLSVSDTSSGAFSSSPRASISRWRTCGRIFFGPNSSGSQGSADA